MAMRLVTGVALVGLLGCSQQPFSSSFGGGGTTGAGAVPGAGAAGGGGALAGAGRATPGAGGVPMLPPAGGGAQKAAYPDAILCLPGSGDERCGPGYDPTHALGEGELAAAFDAGLAAWTTPDSTGGACVSCHSPDGIDLAKIGYSDCDIRRRALDHVNAEQAEAIVDLVHALRQVYAVEAPLHPDKYRPLQPGYLPFGEPADDIEVADSELQDARDQAFMEYLTGELGLTWATTKIDSLELAHQAYQQLLDLDLRTLKLGIPFDRFSEDPSAADNECTTGAGPAHRGQSIFEWVPGMPSVASPGQEQAWQSLLAEYRADPSTANLWRYYDAIDELTGCGYELEAEGEPEYYARACDWMRHKYKSLQVLQHMLRHDSLAHPDQLADVRVVDPQAQRTEHLETIIARSPIWETADLIRVAPLQRPGDPACFSSDAHPCTYLPPAIDQSVHSLPTHQEALINQGDLFQISWFVMSFLEDPTLTQHSENFATFIGDYLESVLLPRYDIHHAFVFAVMAARKSAASDFLDYPGFRQGTGKIASVRTFSFKQVRDNFSPPPAGARLETHRRMFANFARMWIYLIEEDLRLTGTVYGRDGQLGGGGEQGGLLSAVRFMREWIAELEGQDDAAINALVVAIEALASTATELRTEDNYEAYDGLQPTNRWGDYQTPFGG